MPNGRCRMHGGKYKVHPAPKGNRYAVTHGLYAGGLLDDEKQLLSQVKLESLDDELTMLKIMLRRAYIAERRWEEQHELLDRKVDWFMEADERLPEEAHTLLPIVSVERETAPQPEEGGGAHTRRQKVIRRRRNFTDEIIRLTKLIMHLVGVIIPPGATPARAPTPSREVWQILTISAIQGRLQPWT